MIEAMIRLEKTLASHLPNLKTEFASQGSCGDNGTSCIFQNPRYPLIRFTVIASSFLLHRCFSGRRQRPAIEQTAQRLKHFFRQLR
jgi:hypothetical protein